MTRSHPHLSRVLAPCVHITGHNHGTDVIVTSDKRDGAKVSIPIDCSVDILPTAKAGGFLGLMRGECWRSCGHPCIGPVGSGFAGDCFSKLKSDTASTGV